MKTYLFDTNIWSKWYRQEDFVLEKIKQLDGNSKICLSPVVWGEIIYGAKAQKNFDYKAYRNFIHKPDPIIIEIDKNVSEIYGDLKAKLFEKFIRKGKNKRPEQLIDPVTATEIGIEENDLWIVAQAVTHNLTFVTNDKMRRIFTVTPKELKHEIWQ